MTSKLVRTCLFAALALAPASVRADYLGLQPGGGQITVGAFAPTINGVVVQLTKSVPVDPVTGLAINPATDAKLEAVRALLAAALTVNLPTGAATDAKLEAVRALLANPLTISLPAGAATAAKQPAPGTAGTPSADVLSMQGSPNGTPLPADTVIRSTSTDRGGTITAGGTAQQFMAANATRRGFTVQNQSTGDLYINCVATAAANQTSLRVPAGALYESSPHHAGTGACSIFGATTAQAFYSREF